MDETILCPSPNWFQVSVLAVSKDRWLVYGGPSRSLCILEPLPTDNKGLIHGTPQYKAHVINKVHQEKIISVDISPEWPEKRCVLTGSIDGGVKQWLIENENNALKMKQTHSHDIHCQDKEELVGVGYSNEIYAITIGVFGNIVKWDLNSNVVKTYHFFKTFRPTCMSCSRHLPLHVAAGTKQGVIFVMDLTGPGKIVYKVRGQDDEIVNVSWCPQYNVAVKKALDQVKEKFSVASRLESIRNEPEPNEEDKLNFSGTEKALPEDSFNETVVEEDDTFDIYKDHEADEFGHKKFQPEDVFVKIKSDEVKQDDYLAECLKLKEEILKRKNESEQSIETLVDAFDKTQIDTAASGSKDCIPDSDDKTDTGAILGDVGKTIGDNKSEGYNKSDKQVLEASDHIHKHLLATIGKYGCVRIWSKTGKLVASCTIQSGEKNPKNKSPSWPTLLWYTSDKLLVTDGRSQLLECNPLIIDCKNKLKYKLIHKYHKRGLYCVMSDAPRVQSSDIVEDDWLVWSVAQDRSIIRYNLKLQQKIAVHHTCGGFVYTVKACPYDAGKVAVSVGDGGVRVWQTTTCDEDGNKLAVGDVLMYWQNVQGKVLTVAWHPTKENRLAFSTAESRIGLIDTSGKTEKAARAFPPAVSGGVYSLCWGEENDLYACGRGNIYIYDASNVDKVPQSMSVAWEGQQWEISTAVWYPRGLVVGTNSGAVGLLTPNKPHKVIAVAFVFGKMIHTVDWHPQETTSSSEESQYRNLIAVCSLDKTNSIVILECTSKDGGSQQLSTWKTLNGHKAPVLQIQWNPHRDAQLLSTSQDSTIRIWNAVNGVCTSIFTGHSYNSLGASWSAFPQFADKVISGGGDCCLRLWDINDHPADKYDETIHELANTKEKKKKVKKELNKNKAEQNKNDDQSDLAEEEHLAANQESKIKASKKFILSLTQKQISECNVNCMKKMLDRHLGNVSSNQDGEETLGTDFLKMFGSINEVNELLDKELHRHLSNSNFEAWAILMVFRGHIDPMVQLANQKDMLCPYLLSLTPCVSFKYWKDATQLYLAQIDRLVAKGMADKLCENRTYGGPVYRKAATLLSLHDIKGAVATLIEAKLYKEAYVLCKIRYMDSIAQETLENWTRASAEMGIIPMTAICNIALGKLGLAAETLAHSNKQEYLSIAADLAKISGQNTFADHIEKKVQAQMQEEKNIKTEEILQELPSKIELLLRDVQSGNTDVIDDDTGNTGIVTNGNSEVKES